MDMLQGFGDLFNVGEPSGAGGLKVLPLFPMGPAAIILQTLRDVVGDGDARIEEAADGSWGPWFRALSLVNESAHVVLVSDGDLLTAGLQGRIVDTPRCVRPGGRVRLQVSCVEAGRSSRRDRADLVTAEPAAEPSVRRRRMLRSLGGGRPDQQETWDHVAELRGARGHHDGGSLAERSALDGRASAIAARLPVAYGATGLAVARNTSKGARVVLLEWFADPAACATAWAPLVRSAAMEVRHPEVDVKISRTELRRAVARAASAVVREEAFAEGDRVAWIGGAGAMTGRAVALGEQLVNVALVG